MQVFKEKMGNVFKILSEAVSEGIIVINENQTIVAANGSAKKMFGYTDESLVGQHLNILIPNNSLHSHSSDVNLFLKKSDSRSMGHSRDLFGKRKDNSQFPLEAGLNPFEIFGNKYVMALVIDITIRKSHESQINDVNLKLEDKIIERTIELNKTVLELKSEIHKRKEAEKKIRESLKKERELNDLKTKFLSLVSHEFKTPLSGILTSASLIGKYNDKDGQLQREKHMKIIQNKVKYLNNILTDFLSIEKLESGKSNYTIHEFPLERLIKEVLYDTNMLLKKGQKIVYPDNLTGITVKSDEKILELIIFNVINNAIKYSSEYSTITLSIDKTEDKVLIAIHDTGIGIPEDEQKFIFNRYFRAANALLNQGTGIGLNIVKSHLENLGGTISFKSEKDVGSTFTLEIPLMSNLVKL